MRKKVVAASVLALSFGLSVTPSVHAAPEGENTTLGGDYDPDRKGVNFKFSPLDDSVRDDIFKNRRSPDTVDSSIRHRETTTKTTTSKTTVKRKTVTVTVTPTITQDVYPPDWEGYVTEEDTGQAGVSSGIDLSDLDIGEASSAAKKAVKYAYEQLGTPYVWGGTTMSTPGTGNGGLDCSGLTQGVYAKAGVSLPRVTYGQVNSGRAVSMAQIQPGDLVFYNSTGHVAIYVGGGKVIHAPQAGQNVKIDPVGMMAIENIRRVA